MQHLKPLIFKTLRVIQALLIKGFEMLKTYAFPAWKSEAQKLKPIIVPPQQIPSMLFQSMSERIAFFALAIGFIGLVAVFIDPWVTSYQNNWNANLYHIMRRITHLGSSGMYLFPLGMLSLILSILAGSELSPKHALAIRIWASRALYLFVVIAGSGIFATILKRLIGRARPKMFELFGALHFSPISTKSYYASFPSGHATTAFALAIALCFFMPRWRIILIAIATSIAFSRIVLGSHHLSDVIMGGLIGTAFTIFITKWAASSRYVFEFDANKRIKVRGNKISPLGIKAISSMLHHASKTPPQTQK